MRIFTGLLALGRSAISGLGGAATRAAPAVVRAAPALAAATVGGAAFQAGTNLLTGGPSAVVQAPGAAGPPLLGAAGPAGQFVVLGDGSRALLSSTGVPLRAQFFITAGAQLPGGAKIVSISPDGLLFGIRRAPRRRTFRTELSRCTSVVKTADKLLKVLGRRK